MWNKILGLSLVALTLPANAWAQELEPPSVAQVTSQLAAVELRTDLEELAKKRAVEAYKRALGSLTQVEEFRSRAEQAEKLALSTPRELEEAKARLNSLVKPASPSPPANATLADLEASQVRAQREAEEIRSQYGRLRREVEQRSERRRLLSERLSLVRQQLTASQSATRGGLASSEPALAEDVAARATFAALALEVRALDRELAADQVRADLVPIQRDLAKRELVQAEDLVSAWSQIVSQLRREEATNQAKRARELLLEAARSSPELRSIAEETKGLADRRIGSQGLTSRREAAEREIKGRQAALRVLRESFARLRRRVEAGVPSETLGILLRRQLEALPALEGLGEERRKLSTRLAKLQADLVELEERRAAEWDIGLVLESLADKGPDAKAAFGDVAREVLASRRDLLGALVGEHQRLIEDLLELDQILNALALASSELRGYSEERILWIPSVQGSLVPSVRDLRAGAAWLIESKHLPADLQASRLHAGPAASALLGILLLALPFSLLLRRRTAQPVEGRPLVASAWGIAIRRVSPLFVLCALALVLGSNMIGGHHTRAVAAALRTLGLYGAVLSLVWGIAPFAGGAALRRLLQLSAPPFLVASAIVAALEHSPDLAWTNGVGRVAFVLAMGVEAIALGSALRSSGPLGSALRSQGGLVGRLAPALSYFAPALPLIMALLAVGGFYYTALRLEVRFEATLLLVLSALFLYDVLLATLSAPAEAALPVSSEVLFQSVDAVRAEPSPSLEPGAEVQLELSAPAAEEPVASEPPGDSSSDTEDPEATLRVNVEEPVASDSPGDPGSNAEDPEAALRAKVEGGLQEPEPVEAEPVDAEISARLIELAEQARDTVRVVVTLGVVIALAALWADVLPAFRRLRDLRLYPSVEVVETSKAARYPALEGLALAPSPGATERVDMATPPSAALPLQPALNAAAPSDTSPLIITAADLGLALLFFIVTIALVRRLPGALEFALIGRLPLDAGARYAASTIARYAVIFVGLALSMQALGIGWARIQWLAAALTFGLAFGLQEIFANFISGLIILFERPVRVGDIVTLGDVTGKVTRVHMRATTITDWNRRELIIPNKELVTGRVVNWTLTESVTRTVIPIGLAYGSDVDQARGLILAAAQAQPEVLTDPAPTCWFEAFGDSFYDLQLRIYLPEPKHILPTRHAILELIRQTFAEAGLEIAFPQRDLHLRSIDPAIRILSETSSPESAR